MKLESLKHLYREQLEDPYSSETQLLDALPRTAEAASASGLKLVNG